MKKALIVSFCIIFALSSIAMAKPVAKVDNLKRNRVIPNNMTDLPPDALFSTAQADTYVLGDWTFDSGGSCVDEGWVTVDMTVQSGVRFHVDNNIIPSKWVIEGSHAMWCGHRVAVITDPDYTEFCGYCCLPGYGNGWDQIFESDWLAATGDVMFTYGGFYDSESCCDYTQVEYLDTDSVWVNLATYAGIGTIATIHYIPAAAYYADGSLRLRFHFTSDGGWSDYDGLYPSDGAIVLDTITVRDTVGTVCREDFELEPVDTTATRDGLWRATMPSGYGDFGGLFPGVSVLQEDVCTYDPTCLWGFFKNSGVDYACSTPIPHPEQEVVPYVNDIGQYIWNEIWSPNVAWNYDENGAPIPAGAVEATIEFKVYLDLPLQNLMFYMYHVRSLVGTCPEAWKDNNVVFYGGPTKRWGNFDDPIGLFVNPLADSIQVALAAIDMCGAWCPYFGPVTCHSHSPLFDDVKVYRTSTTGPIWQVFWDFWMFQDNFPSDATTTGTVRCDMAGDRMPYTSMNIDPGDSAVVTVVEPNLGLETTGGPDGRADVYCYVRSTGGELPPTAYIDDPTRFPYVGGPTAGGYYQFQCDTTYTDAGPPIDDSFCFDLNDDFFTPPDRIDFYFSATDNGGNTTYWSQGAGTTPNQAEVEAEPNEMQCLPTGNSQILYVDDFSGRGAQPYFDTAFDLLGVNPDRYDVRSPSSGQANSVGARAFNSQVTNVYHKIIWSSGNLSSMTIGDSTTSGEKSDDAGLLFNFLDQSSIWGPGLYMTGDNIAAELKILTGPSVGPLLTYIDYTLTNADHVAAGSGVAPLVIGLMPATFFQHDPDGGGPLPAYPDTLIAYGGCPGINQFDVMGQTGASTLEMYYDDLGPAAGAVMSQTTANAYSQPAHVVLEGFSYHYIRDDRPTVLNDRADHLLHILRDYFENIIDPPTGGEVPLPTRLSQNFPNPFNPQTTIEFYLREKAHVSLKIYNVAGQLVKTLRDEVMEGQISYTEPWSGLNDRGQPVASGVYFYKLVTKNFTKTRKMVLLK